MAASASTSARAEQADRVLVITRVFDAPRALVFKAWTDPVHLMRWKGPRGFTTTSFTRALTPGGAWRSCMRRDDTGEELWQSGVYREIVPPERLVFTYAWDQDDGSRGPETLVTITFAEHGGRTTMTFRQALFDTAESRDGHQGGWTSSFERLDEYLASL